MTTQAIKYMKLMPLRVSTERRTSLPGLDINFRLFSGVLAEANGSRRPVER